MPSSPLARERADPGVPRPAARQARERAGRDAQPSAGVIDAQSVKADAVVGADIPGFDGGKLINGRKRHVVAAAHHRLELVWADGR